MTRFNKQGSPYQMKNTIKEKTMIRYEKEGKKRIGKERKGMKRIGKETKETNEKGSGLERGRGRERRRRREEKGLGTKGMHGMRRSKQPFTLLQVSHKLYT